MEGGNSNNINTNMDVTGDGSGGGGAGGGWGTMGGDIGDGGFLSHQISSTVPTYTPSIVTMNNPSTPTFNGGGSITRFASPSEPPPQAPPPPPPPAQNSSYLPRSQQSYGGYQQQGHQQTYMNQQQQPPPAPTSYAARSQQSYYGQQQPNQQSYNNTYQQPTQQPGYGAPPNQPTADVAGTGSYAARSQQLYGGANQQQQPQQQHPQQPPYQEQYQQSGSFASRSAQAYGTSTGVPQQQQQPSGSLSYAERSAQAIYGVPQQQPQQQQVYGTSNIPQQQFPGQQQQAYVQPGSPAMPGQPSMMAPYGGPPGAALAMRRQHEAQQQQALQQKILTDTTRKIQEHAYHMKQAMEQRNLPVVLDRAAHMVGELGGPPHGHQNYQAQQGPPNPNNPNNPTGPTTTTTGGSAKLTPKNYYELYMRALEEMPSFEEYLLTIANHGSSTGESQPADVVPQGHIRIIDTSGLSYSQNPTPNVSQKSYTMRELYDCVQYCPRVVSRLYLQIAAGSALLRSGEAGAKFVLKDLQDAVKCEQNPIRGLFLRHYLLTALKDKLPTQPAVHQPPENEEEPTKADDAEAPPSEQNPSNEASNPELESGTVQDSYEFILANFMEMNKLWVRLQHLPGEGKNKEVRKKRERERNDLRILVGTNLVRLSQLANVTSKVYGESILPGILDHIVVAGDPLSQAYIMDCLVQAFPDEYHIETLPILLHICPRLRDKVNIRTILQGLMDRLANYLADEELLDESDTNEVKKTLARDSFGMFEECIQSVYNAKGPKLTSREVIRLQTSLLQFSIRCYSGNVDQVRSCISSCVAALSQANASYEFHDGTVVEMPQKVTLKPLDDVAVVELEKFLSIPLESLALKVLQFEDYSRLIGFLPWANRREVAIKMLGAAVDGSKSDSVPSSIQEADELFQVLEPLIRDEHPINGAIAARMADMSVSQAPQQQQHGYQPSFGSATSTSYISYYTPEQLQLIRRENTLVSKLVHLLTKSKDRSFAFEVLQLSRKHIRSADGGAQRLGSTLVSLVFAALHLSRRIVNRDESKPAVALATVETTTAESETAASSTEKIETEDQTQVDETEPGNNTEPTDMTEPATKNEEEAPSNAISTVPSRAIEQDEELSVRKVFVFVQEVISELAKYKPETSFKLALDAALTSDSFVAHKEARIVKTDFAVISFEFLSQAFSLYDENITDSKIQYRCIVSMAGTLMSLQAISKQHYEGFITKTAQCAAKIPKKHEQCQLVALCAHLFYPVGSGTREMKYSNPQRALECLQRCLKLADASTATNPAHIKLFVEILEQYVFFFEQGNPSVTHAYITGLVALIKEHLTSLSGGEALLEAKAHFLEVNRYILKQKGETDSAQLFAAVNLG